MMNLRKQIVSVARSWLNTPFHYQMRSKGLGCDCIGLVLGIANDLGTKLPKEFFSIYDHHNLNDTHFLEKKLREHTNHSTSIAIGNIALFKNTRYGAHVGVITDYQQDKYALLHSCMKRGMVVEHRLLPELMREAEYFDLYISLLSQ